MTCKTSSTKFWLGYDFYDSNYWYVLDNRVIPLLRHCSSWIHISSPPTCISGSSLKISSCIYSFSVSCTSCHHTSVRKISKSISNDRIPVMDPTSMKQKPRSKLLLHLLKGSFLVSRVVKYNVFLKSRLRYYLIVLGKKFEVMSICADKILNELISVHCIYFTCTEIFEMISKLDIIVYYLCDII